MNLKQQRAAAFEAAKSAYAAMEADETLETVKAAEEAALKVKELDTAIEKHKRAMAIFDDMKSTDPVQSSEIEGGSDDPLASAKSLGEFFVKAVGDQLHRVGPGSRASVVAPDFKAATDPQVTGGPDGGLGVFLTEIDRTILHGVRRPTITNLFGQGTIKGQAITYFVEGALEGDFETVAELGQYPQLHVTDPTPVTDAISKLGGFIKMSDEMLADLDFLVSEINTRLLYQLGLVEEYQVLYGDGTGTDLLGVLERNGIQTGTADSDTLADEIFKSMTKVYTASGLSPDGLVINPKDYEGLRLLRDSNEQYYGGGFFQNQYGAGSFANQPSPWGLRTIITPAVPQGTAVVGAFKQAATVYQKGGVRVEATNSDDKDFTKGQVTVRATKRLALAVRRPAGFVNITIS